MGYRKMWWCSNCENVVLDPVHMQGRYSGVVCESCMRPWKGLPVTEEAGYPEHIPRCSDRLRAVVDHSRLQGEPDFGC